MTCALRVLLIVVGAFFATGCSNNQFTLSKAELVRQSRLPPEQRGEFQATQGFYGDAKVPEPQVPVTAAAGAAGAVADAPTLAPTVAYAPATPPRHREAVPPPHPGIWGGVSYHGPVGHNAHAGAPVSGGGKVALPKFKIPGLKRIAPVVIAVVVVAAIAAAGFAFAASEGERFKGGVRVLSDHPVYLLNYEGKLRHGVPLSSIDAAQLEGVRGAVISERDGPVERLAAAPLDRVGLTYNIEGGLGGMNMTNRRTRGGAQARLQIGGFPVQSVGIYGGVAFTFGSKATSDVTVDTRPFVELQFWPANVGRAHFGMYAESGYTYGGDHREGKPTVTNGVTWGGGALFQWEISPFLALNVRAGALRHESQATGAALSPSATLGLSVF